MTRPCPTFEPEELEGMDGVPTNALRVLEAAWNVLDVFQGARLIPDAKGALDLAVASLPNVLADELVGYYEEETGQAYEKGTSGRIRIEYCLDPPPGLNIEFRPPILSLGETFRPPNPDLDLDLDLDLYGPGW